MVYKPMRSEARSNVSEGCRLYGMTILIEGEGQSLRPSFEVTGCWSSSTQPMTPSEKCSTLVAPIAYDERSRNTLGAR